MARTLVIKATAGKDDPERCNQAFTVAAAAVASGVQVSFWLTGEAAWFSVTGRAADFSLPHAAPLTDLLASVLALGTVTVCSQPDAVITADAVSETRSKKHTPATMAKDKNRARRKLTRLLPGFGLTPQMVLSASCNWPNTPLAPKSATAIPTTVAMARGLMTG